MTRPRHRIFTDEQGRRWRVHDGVFDLPTRKGTFALLVLYGDESLEVLEVHPADDLREGARRRLHRGAAWIAAVVAGRGVVRFGQLVKS